LSHSVNGSQVNLLWNVGNMQNIVTLWSQANYGSGQGWSNKKTARVDDPSHLITRVDCLRARKPRDRRSRGFRNLPSSSPLVIDDIPARHTPFKWQMPQILMPMCLPRKIVKLVFYPSFNSFNPSSCCWQYRI
jgi:hypothetical protein